MNEPLAPAMSGFAMVFDGKMGWAILVLALSVRLARLPLALAFIAQDAGERRAGGRPFQFRLPAGAVAGKKPGDARRCAHRPSSAPCGPSCCAMSSAARPFLRQQASALACGAGRPRPAARRPAGRASRVREYRRGASARTRRCTRCSPSHSQPKAFPRRCWRRTR